MRCYNMTTVPCGCLQRRRPRRARRARARHGSHAPASNPRQSKIQTKKVPIGSSPRRSLPNVTHASRPSPLTPHAYGRCLLGRGLEVRDEIRAVLGLLKAREDHLGARDVLLGVEEVVVEGILAPLDALVLVSGGVGEALGGAGDATEETAEVGALWSWITELGRRRSVDGDFVFHSCARQLQSRFWEGFGIFPPGATRRGGAIAAGCVRIDGCGSRERRAYLLVTAAGLGHVALRALGLENLGACGHGGG